MRSQRGGGRWSAPPPEKSQTYKNSGPDPLKKRKATKPALNVGPLAFRWQADVGPHIVIFGSSLLSTTKKNKNLKVGPLWQNFLDLRMRSYFFEATK